MGDSHFLVSKLTTKLHLIKTLWYWHKDRHTDPYSRIESLEINLHIYGQLIFEKTVKNIVAKTAFSTNGSRINWICACNTNNLDPYLIPHMKMSLIGQRPNVTDKTIQLLERSLGINL